MNQHNQQPDENSLSYDYSERYQRPSKQPALPNPYTLQSFMDNPNPPVMKNPEDVVYAYYGILKEASNMEGFTGGCGSIGDGKVPYPYAYRLLTQDTRNKLTLQKYIHSFRGIGHITFLKIYPAYAPSNTPPDTRYYMIEIEVITGQEIGDKQLEYKNQITYFAYYYGLVTVKKENSEWRIQTIRYYPEEFLCAPYHSWFYDAEAVVQIVYQDNLKLIDTINKTEQNDGLISVYASGNGNRYRFDFVRLTNGHDILLHEYIWENGSWTETDLLTKDWQNIKLSVRNL